MASKTLTRADLSEAVHRDIGLSRTESAEMVKSVLDLGFNGPGRGNIGEALFLWHVHGAQQKGPHRAQSKNRRRGAHYAAPGDGVPSKPGDEKCHKWS